MCKMLAHAVIKAVNESHPVVHPMQIDIGIAKSRLHMNSSLFSYMTYSTGYLGPLTGRGERRGEVLVT